MCFGLIFFRRLCRAGFDQSFCSACLVFDSAQTWLQHSCLWTPKWGEKSVPKTSTLSKVLPSARTCGYQDNEPSHEHSIQNVIFSGVTSRKIIGNVDPKMGCKIWTPFWGPPNCFFFPRAPNGVQILGPILGSTLLIFCRVTPAKRSSPSRMLVSRFVCFTSTLQEQCQDMWLSRQRTFSRAFYSKCDFFRRHFTKNNRQCGP